MPDADPRHIGASALTVCARLQILRGLEAFSVVRAAISAEGQTETRPQGRGFGSWALDRVRRAVAVLDIVSSRLSPANYAADAYFIWTLASNSRHNLRMWRVG
jgi:hypothetical protein